MKKISITDNEENKYYGQLPDGWHEVTLSQWITFEREKESKPEEQALACMVAALTGLPVNILLEDQSLVVLILRQVPWTEAMAKPAPLESFLHQDVTYEPAGTLNRFSMSRFEQMLHTLEQKNRSQLQALPELLAVIYKPVGSTYTKETAKATAEAFQSLPMDIAWAAVVSLLEGYGSHTAKLLALNHKREEVLNSLTLTENALKGVPANKHFMRMQAWLLQVYIRNVKKLV